MKKIFKTQLNAAVIVLIPACIGINYLGKLFASFLKLPLWLDSCGTCIGAALGGPIIGAICGAANNLIYGFTTGDNITLVYALTSLFIGLVLVSWPVWVYEEFSKGFINRMRWRSGCSCCFYTTEHPVLGRYNRKCMG